jgi:hypothetical protein
MLFFMQSKQILPCVDRNCIDHWQRWRRLMALLLVVGILLTPTPAQAQGAAAPTADSGVEAAEEAAQSWLEPRGLSVVDLVGLVPEEHLRDTIVTWRVGSGFLQYVSGQRTGNTVTVNVKIFPRYWTDGTNFAAIFNCLGKTSLSDEWTSAIGPAQMRVYENGVDVTRQIVPSFDYVPAGQILPVNGGVGQWRYDSMWDQKPTFTDNGAINVPANMGCEYAIGGKRTNLTATFVVESTNYITVDVLGNQDFTFRSYIGVGNAGHFSSLNSQMNGRFGDRHDKFSLAVPTGADYVLVKYPPTPVDPYAGSPEINADQPASGSYRIVGSGNTLSVDHVHSMAMPLYGQWQDADQSGGNYLKFFRNISRIAVPEYFVPAGIAYHPCMRNGGCSGDLLDRIYNATMTMSVYYYRVGRIADGLNRIPLRQVGPSWSPGDVATADAPSMMKETVAMTRIDRQQQNAIYLPVVTSAPAPPAIRDDGDRTGCPCGWFDGLGRMLDYVPGP